MSEGAIAVTVVYALAEAATVVEVALPAGSTVADAIARSGIAALHPDADVGRCGVGVFGARSARTRLLADGDRVELYRPLHVDPKLARIRRAARR